MGTNVAVLEIIQPVLEYVAIWRNGQGVDDAIVEEVCSRLTIRFYWLLHVSSVISSRSFSCVKDTPFDVVDIFFGLIQLFKVASFPSS